MSRFRIAAACLGLVLAAPGGRLHAEATTFRLSDLDLRDPHVFVQVVTTCTDFTNSGIGGSFNGKIQAGIQTDGDADGYLDRSYLIQFLPLAQAQATNLIDVGTAQCTAPIEGTSCGAIDGTSLAGDAALSNSTACLAPIAGTTNGAYAPAITSSGAPCFVSQQGDITIDFAGIPLTLHKARIAATFTGDPATALSNGLLSGFVSEADANATTIPQSIALVGGMPLSSVLRGGTNNCASGSDKDVDGVTPGWWFYFNFPAARLQDRPDDVFANGFESP